MKHSTELAVSVLAVDLLCEHFCYLLTPTYADKPVEFDSLTSPPPLLEAEAGVIFHLHYLATISFLFNPLLSIEHESKAALNATKLHEK